jgi:hypothetical protein
MITFDIGNLLVNLWKVWKEDREFQNWVKLGLSCGFSGFIALTGTWGGALVAHSQPWVAFGLGLCACAVAVFTVLVRMPQGKSLLIAVPSEVAKQYAAAGQTIEEPVKK